MSMIEKNREESPSDMGTTSAAAVPAPVRKIHRALLPLFVSLVVVCYLDRTSLAFAALQLCNTDWFNAKVYGLGSGVFYAGYVLFQIPSNLLLSRLGAKLWLPVITAAFGLVAVCSGLFIKGPLSFYLLRLALGVAEAGVFPGMWHVCGQFYPNTHITVPYSVIEASIAISQILAAPAAAALLQLSGVLGLQGWQWLFLAEGLATLVIAGVLRWRLPASVTCAQFLTSQDKVWLLQQLGMNAAAGVWQQQQQSRAAALGRDVDERLDNQVAALLVDVSMGGSDKHSARQAAQVAAYDGIKHRGGSCTNLQDLQPICSQQHSKEELDTAAAAAAAAAAGDGASAERHVSSSSSTEVKLTPWQQVYHTFRNKLILYLMLLKALKDIALDGLVYWVPMLVHALMDGNSISLSVHSSATGEHKSCGGKESQLQAVLLSSIPFGTAAVAAVLVGHSSEKRQERKLHIGLPLLMGGCAFALLPLLLQLDTHVPAFVAVTAAVVAADATTGPFWSWVHSAATAGTGAVSLAAVNSVGKAGGFLGPLSFGLILHATGSYVPSILLVGAVLLCGGAMALFYAGERMMRYQKLPEVHTDDQHEMAKL